MKAVQMEINSISGTIYSLTVYYYIITVDTAD